MDAFALLGSILAQADTTPVPSASVQVQSVWDFIVKGGVMMIPIGACSLVALAVIVERSVSLSRRRVIPAGFLDGLRAALTNPRDGRDAALDYCGKDASPVANVFAAAIRRIDEPVEVLERHVEQAGAREVFKLRKYMRVLSVIASIAPLLGLLGTIFGMIRAFQTVATSPEALGRTEMLARGIYEAMITTAAGLSVAIPVLIGYHWISAKVDRLVGEIDLMTVEFVEEHARPVNGREEANETRPKASGAGKVVESAPSVDVSIGAQPQPATAGN